MQQRMVNSTTGTDFIAYCEQVMHDNGNLSRKTVSNFRTSINVLKSFLGREQLPMEEFNRPLVNGLAVSMAEKGFSESTSRTYLRPLKVIYNRAVREGLMENTDAFDDIQLSVQVKTVRKGKRMKRVWVPEEIGTVLSRLGELYLDNERVKDCCEQLAKDLHEESIKEIIREMEGLLVGNPLMEDDCRELIERSRRLRRRRKLMDN